METIPSEILSIILTHLHYHRINFALTNKTIYKLYQTLLFNNLQIKKRFERIETNLTECIQTNKITVTLDRILTYDNDKYIIIKIFSPCKMNIDQIAMSDGLKLLFFSLYGYIYHRERKMIFVKENQFTINSATVHTYTWISISIQCLASNSFIIKLHHNNEYYCSDEYYLRNERIPDLTNNITSLNNWLHQT